MDYVATIQTIAQRSLFVFLPFLTCVTFLLLFQQLAPRLGLLDRPDERKRHDGPVPPVGGPAMYVAIGAAGLFLAFQYYTVVFLGLGLLLVLLGLADDLFDIRASLRLVGQIAVAAGMVQWGHVTIDEVGNLLGSGAVALPATVAVTFTVMCTVGVVNAVNMIDGLDGLAGSILLVSFGAMAWLAVEQGDALSAKLLATYCGALLGFLCFNARVFVRRARIFMGDSGSMLLGFVLAWYLIRLSQDGQHSIGAVTAGWIFGLPLVDTVSVMVGRVLSGRSPFAAGRDHLHHRLVDRGWSVNRTVLTLVAVHAAFVGVGVASNDHPEAEPYLFWLFVALVLVHHAVVSVLKPASRDARAARACGDGRA